MDTESVPTREPQAGETPAEGQLGTPPDLAGSGTPGQGETAAVASATTTESPGVFGRAKGL